MASCPAGHFKATPGSVACSPCPANSRTSTEGSGVCECRSGFYRAPSDDNSTACTEPPSAPLALSWEYETGEGGVSLRWRPPQDMGGRGEVWYSIVCRICPSASITSPGVCSWCGEAVTYTPSQTGLRQTKVTLNNLLTRVTYLIQVQAINEVSALSPFPPRFASINFTTSQWRTKGSRGPGSDPQLGLLILRAPCPPSPSALSGPHDAPAQPGPGLHHSVLAAAGQAQRGHPGGTDEDTAVSVFTETNTVTVNALAPGSIYAFQIRARNERGFGPYSRTSYFTTLALGAFSAMRAARSPPSTTGAPLRNCFTRDRDSRAANTTLTRSLPPTEERSKQVQNRLPLLVGSVMGGAAVLLVVAAIVIVFVFRSKRRASPYSDRLQRYISNRGGVKYYVDPSTYEDPSEAVREFAKEIDPAHLKIEEVIGAAPHNCPPAIHALMLQCWQADRQDRPGFDSLVSSLDRLIRHPASLKAENSWSTQPLLSPTPTDLSTVTTVSDWLTALRMDRYKDEFERAQIDSLEKVSTLTMEDIQNLGVNLLGHQRKIVNAAQQLRIHLTQGQVEV
ncbi:ephrin type-B receptor 5-like [Scleropages formosus]|uniref:Ephrin type-B receptor 5-like n=1 Tax=Scleropages formosus TaxID=113540 RepID=A0A0P7U3A3_SCLFO|nr:ephrin type-B receptor 5-like [Scleropages formosus]